MRFSRMLPSLVLVAATVLILVALPRLIRVRHDPSHPDPFHRPSIDSSDYHTPDPLEIAAELGMPAIVVEPVISYFTTWPRIWQPGFPYPFNDLWLWRAVFWPILSLPLWIAAGRALDIIFRPRLLPRIRLLIAIPMLVVGVACGLLGLLCYGYALSDGIHDGTRWIIVPGTLWFVLGTLPAIAWIRQRSFFKRS